VEQGPNITPGGESIAEPHVTERFPKLTKYESTGSLKAGGYKSLYDSDNIFVGYNTIFSLWM